MSSIVSPNEEIHNPVEKVLEMSLLDVDWSKLTKSYLKPVMDHAIGLSKAHVVFSKAYPFKKKEGQKGPKGVSIVYILSESDASLHTTPEKYYVSLDIETCGDKTHPFSAVKYILRALDPSAGNIGYSKMGMDLTSSYFPKSLDALVHKYTNQFNREKYIFIGREFEAGDYNIYFWNPKEVDKEKIIEHFKLTKKQLSNYKQI
jgi:S-adenosylmethionine/arginine decarboxylase-like enzyme